MKFFRQADFTPVVFFYWVNLGAVARPGLPQSSLRVAGNLSFGLEFCVVGSRVSREGWVTNFALGLRGKARGNAYNGAADIGAEFIGAYFQSSSLLNRR